MELRDRAIALYGRFSAGARDQLQRAIARAGGRVARDLTRRSDGLVVGALASVLIDSGALASRLRAAKARGLQVWGERAFAAAILGGAPPEAATLPLSTALSRTPLTVEDAEMLAAFDLIGLKGDRCRFGDAGVIRTASDLVEHGRARSDVVRILTRARDLSPHGLHKIVLTPSGEAALQWNDGLTTLEGQGFLPLDEDHPGLDDLFDGGNCCAGR